MIRDAVAGKIYCKEHGLSYVAPQESAVDLAAFESRVNLRIPLSNVEGVVWGRQKQV